MKLIEDLESKKKSIAVIGLGYVGLPLAIEFAKDFDVVGFDINKKKISDFRLGIDPTNEVGSKIIKDSTLIFSSDEEDLKNSNLFIIAVPTPIDLNMQPDLAPLVGATDIVARNLKSGSIIVFESTVYPGTTEDICVPILENGSGLKFGKDFGVGYSPERINPGDKMHTLRTIKKVISGNDELTISIVKEVYSKVIDAGLFLAKSIKVAEAAKVIENAQRDINIAFINELNIIFNKLDIDTKSVLETAATKWNFLPFSPGMVGGHCIGVDPYYLTYIAQKNGYEPNVILAGRNINNNMSKYYANQIQVDIKRQINQIRKILICGITFKENVPDIRNSKIIELYSELLKYGHELYVHDPIANKSEVKDTYNIELKDLDEINDIDIVIFTVKHKIFSSYLKKITKVFSNKDSQRIIYDLKYQFSESDKSNHFSIRRI